MSSKGHWLDLYEDLSRKYDELADAVRSMSGDPVLLKMVGPSEEEQRKALKRVEKLQELRPRCMWDAPIGALTLDAIEARRKYMLLETAQGAYEKRYGLSDYTKEGK